MSSTEPIASPQAHAPFQPPPHSSSLAPVVAAVTAPATPTDVLDQHQPAPAASSTTAATILPSAAPQSAQGTDGAQGAQQAADISKPKRSGLKMRLHQGAQKLWIDACTKLLGRR